MPWTCPHPNIWGCAHTPHTVDFSGFTLACFWPICGTPCVPAVSPWANLPWASRLQPSRVAIGRPSRGLVAKPLLPMGEGPCFHCCVTDNSTFRGTYPSSTTLSGPMGQTPAGTWKLVSAGASAGEAGWLGPGVIQSSLVDVAQKLGSSGPAVGLEHLLTWLLGSGGHVSGVACRRMKQEQPPGFFSFRLY